MATQYVDIIGEGFVQGVPGTFANCRVYYDGSQILHIGALYVDWPAPPPPARTGVAVTVTAFGAAGNGTTDDTTAIQNAINAGAAIGSGVISFPPGNYIISSALIVDNDNIALVGAGQRGTSVITIAGTADPAYALIVGNTKTVNNCSVYGLSFQGRASTSSTGGGINFRSNGGSIKQTQVKFFGGTGINLAAFSGTIFELYLEDVDLVQNGMNTSPGDNLVIGTNVSDCEYIRLITAGDSGKTTTRHGVYLTGGGMQKFVECHAYYCSGNGMYATGGNGIQVIGGEWETNGAKGIFLQNGGSLTQCIISNAHFFGNTSDTDLVADSVSNVVFTGNNCVSAAVKNIACYGCSDVIIANNVALNASGAAIDIDSGSRYIVHDNVCHATANAIQIGATNSDIHDNIAEAGNITEITGANTNKIHHNVLYAGGGQTITRVGSATTIRDNTGYNPIGQVTAPSFPSTTVAATNTTGFDVEVYIANGTAAITVVQIAGVSGSYVTTGYQIAASGWGHIRIPAGGSVKFTYASGTPTWTWFGD